MAFIDTLNIELARADAEKAAKYTAFVEFVQAAYWNKQPWDYFEYILHAELMVFLFGQHFFTDADKFLKDKPSCPQWSPDD